MNITIEQMEHMILVNQSTDIGNVLRAKLIQIKEDSAKVDIIKKRFTAFKTLDENKGMAKNDNVRVNQHFTMKKLNIEIEPTKTDGVTIINKSPTPEEKELKKIGIVKNILIRMVAAEANNEAKTVSSINTETTKTKDSLQDNVLEEVLNEDNETIILEDKLN